MIVLGFCGTFAAGKDAAIEIILKKFGKKAIAVSTSNLVREETTRRGLELTRENLQLVSNDTRFKLGSGIFGKRAAERIIAETKKRQIEVALVSGIRNPGEVDSLRQAFGKNFFLIAVDAPIEVRYQRVKRRGREGEQVLTFEKFKRSEEKELQGAVHSHNILAVMKIADFKIINNGPKAKLEEKIEGILSKVRGR